MDPGSAKSGTLGSVENGTAQSASDTRNPHVVGCFWCVFAWKWNGEIFVSVDEVRGGFGLVAFGVFVHKTSVRLGVWIGNVVEW